MPSATGNPYAVPGLTAGSPNLAIIGLIVGFGWTIGAQIASWLIRLVRRG